MRWQRTLLASLLVWAAFFVAGEARAQDPADNPAYCAAQPGAPNLLPVASAECLTQRQRALNQNIRDLTVAGRVPNYRARVWASHVLVVLGAAAGGIGFIVILEGTRLGHGSGDPNLRMKGIAIMGGGIGLIAGGGALLLATTRRNANREQIDQVQREIGDIRVRRRELRSLRMHPYVSLRGVGLSVTF